jgi:hypothetical protein
MENISIEKEAKPNIPHDIHLLSDPRIKNWMEENAHLQPVQVNKVWQTEYRL